jgi:hypothetical protein
MAGNLSGFNDIVVLRFGKKTVANGKIVVEKSNVR